MPLPRRKKVIALGIIAVGVLVLCTALFALEDRLRETWYLWRLEATEDPASRAEIIERLGRVGGERSFRALCEKEANECPFVFWTRGLPTFRGESPVAPLARIPEACTE